MREYKVKKDKKISKKKNREEPFLRCLTASSTRFLALCIQSLITEPDNFTSSFFFLFFFVFFLFFRFLFLSSSALIEIPDVGHAPTLSTKQLRSLLGWKSRQCDSSIETLLCSFFSCKVFFRRKDKEEWHEKERQGRMLREGRKTQEVQPRAQRGEKSQSKNEFSACESC